MVPSRAMKVALAALALLLAAGCGGGEDSEPLAAAPLVAGCVRLPGARAVQLRVDPSSSADAVLVGGGRAGVVLANQSDRDLCSWAALTRVLIRAGFRVLLFDYSGAEPQTDVAAATERLHRSGVDSVALLGASKGARAVLVAASQSSGEVSAVVSLSAETTGRSGPPRIVPFVRRLQVPALFVAARHDPWTADGADTHELYDAARRSSKELLEVPGAAHGVDLLTGERGSRTTQRIVAFLRRHSA